MGKKIKAKELKNANIQFISLVDRGSNGRPFSFVKSEKDKKRIDIKNIEKMTITEKEKNVFKKIYDFLFTPVKKKEDTGVDKVLEAIGMLSQKIDNVNGRLEKLETQEEEDKNKQNDPENLDTEESQDDDDTDENVNQEVIKALTDLSNQVQNLVTRVEKIEKIRKTPRSHEDIGNQDKDKNVSVFKGIFS